jgi:hypothetical protein
VTLTLETDSSFIDIVDDEVTVAVTSDMEGELSEGFRIRVSDEAPSGFAGFTVTASATDAEVSPHSELEIPAVMIANGGVLVWEGTPMATFSGRYLRDELAARGFEVTYLTGDFPTGLVGFDGAFLSFGNAGLPEAARLDDDWKVSSIQDYLEAGGRLYLDGSDTLGWDIYNLVDGTALLPLFGLEGGVDGDTNPIDNLDGHTGTLTEGMQFTGTNQSPVEWIDIFTPSTGATAFTESDYGVVAVQHEGRYGQRTFCFSYTLAELEDGTTTRADLLDSIIEFLDPTPRPPRRATLRGRASRRVAPTQMKTSGAIQSNSQ